MGVFLSDLAEALSFPHLFGGLKSSATLGLDIIEVAMRGWKTPPILIDRSPCGIRKSCLSLSIGRHVGLENPAYRY